MNYVIEYQATPSNKDIDFLTQQINQETLEFGTAYQFAFFIKDADSKIIAGCNGSVVFGKIYTDQLWVHPNYRKQGLGSKLMEKVHTYGSEVSCTMATVSTMSFQNAAQFYENLGYKKDFERFGHVRGSSCLFMRKEL